MYIFFSRVTCFYKPRRPHTPFLKGQHIWPVKKNKSKAKWLSYWEMPLCGTLVFYGESALGQAKHLPWLLGHFLGHEKKSSTWKCTWKLKPGNAAKLLPVHRDFWLAGASWILHQWLVSRGSGKPASSDSARVMYIQRLGKVFGRGSSCRNSVKVPQLNVFTLQRLKNAGGIMILTAKFKNTAITCSQILEGAFPWNTSTQNQVKLLHQQAYRLFGGLSWNLFLG